ncbi:unnamed protein product [Trifolium pratense]|uniref:Uncharacterized protein n=1 Tax=Trifolium pratense TaxID=57577 RepID=A0ACB0JYI8_TRIPR|nr:unnamed protein product [Trifolium pratense]
MIGNGEHFSEIEKIDSERTSWNLKAKILRLWEVSDFSRPNSPFSLEMVLMDSEGGRIHATVKKTLIYKFKDDLSEGKVYSFENLGVSTNGGAYRTTQHRYKLNFQFGSVVQRITNHDVKGSPFHLVPISDVVSGSYDTDYLVGMCFAFEYFLCYFFQKFVCIYDKKNLITKYFLCYFSDVIGVLTGVGTEREVTSQHGSTTKLNVIALEAQGHKIQCTLFGPYVDELNAFIASGDYNNAVVIVQLAKAKTFQGGYVSCKTTIGEESNNHELLNVLGFGQLLNIVLMLKNRCSYHHCFLFL